MQDQLQQTSLGLADKCHRQAKLEDQLEEYRHKIHRADQLVCVCGRRDLCVSFTIVCVSRSSISSRPAERIETNKKSWTSTFVSNGRATRRSNSRSSLSAGRLVMREWSMHSNRSQLIWVWRWLFDQRRQVLVHHEEIIEQWRRWRREMDHLTRV